MSSNGESSPPAEVWSDPYHQNQSDPSALNIARHARHHASFAASLASGASR